MQFFGSVIDKPLHVLRVKSARDDTECAPGFGNSRTRRRFLRHSDFVIRQYLKQVAQLRSLCLEIFGIMRIRLGADRYLLDHLETVPLEADNFLRVICQKPELPHTETEQN